MSDSAIERRSPATTAAPSEKPDFWSSNTFLVLVLSVILGLILALLYGAVVLLDRTLTAETLQRLPVKVAVSLTLLIGAILLYRIKVSSMQFLYGLTEIAVGLFANWRSMESLGRQLAAPSGENPVLARLAVLAGGVYLIGRGVANLVEGLNRLDMISKKSRGGSPPTA